MNYGKLKIVKKFSLNDICIFSFTSFTLESKLEWNGWELLTTSDAIGELDNRLEIIILFAGNHKFSRLNLCLALQLLLQRS